MWGNGTHGVRNYCDSSPLALNDCLTGGTLQIGTKPKSAHNAMQLRYSELLPFPTLTTTLQPTSQPRALPHRQRAGNTKGRMRMTPREPPPGPGRGAHAAELEGDVAAARVVLRGLQPQRVDRHPPRLDRHCGRNPSQTSERNKCHHIPSKLISKHSLSIAKGV